MKIQSISAALILAGFSLSSCATPIMGTTSTDNSTPTYTSSSSASGSSSQSSQSNLGSLLGGLAGAVGSSSSSSTNQQNNQNSGSSLGSLINGIVGGLLSSDDVNTVSMVGTWAYTSPAVCFKSENFLQQAGGTAAAAVLENKIEPYYNRFKLNQLVLVIDEEMNFTMQSGALRASGVIEKADNGDVLFCFQALKSINIGTLQAYVTISPLTNTMSLMFDVTKLVQIIKGIGSSTNMTTLNTLVALLDSYDGVCVGFKLAKQ